MAFSSKKALKADIEKRAKVALNDLITKIYDELQSFIQQDIYDTYSPKQYERTFDFKNNAWVTSVKKVSSQIVGKIYYDGMRMTYNPHKFQHIDRENLAEILNNTIKNPKLYWDDWTMGRDPWPDPYWDHTLTWLEIQWKGLVTECFGKAGIKLNAK